MPGIQTVSEYLFGLVKRLEDRGFEGSELLDFPWAISQVMLKWEEVTFDEACWLVQNVGWQ